MHAEHSCALTCSVQTAILAPRSFVRGRREDAHELLHPTPHALTRSPTCSPPTFAPGPRSFVRGRQEDAHELLRCLVDALERDLLRAEGRWTPGGKRLQVSA